MSGYVRGAVKGEPRTLSPAEQAKILKVTGQRRDAFRDHMLISLALGTALRENEIRSLDVRDVATDKKEIRSKIQLRTFARKGTGGRVLDKAAEAAEAKRQRVFVPKMVRKKLSVFLAWKKKNGEPVGPDAPLFVGRWSPRIKDLRNARLAVRSIRWIWRTWQERAGFESLYTFHALRHTSLTNLYRVSKDLMVVMKQARHASVETSRIYTHKADHEIAGDVDKLIA